MSAAVRLRELGPGETDVLDAVLAGLSENSRYLRFHTGVPRLTARVRERLAAVDGRSHVAVAAYAGAVPIGIARLIGIGGGRAELAVEVVDAWQRRGVGRRLVRAVAALGRAAGMRELEADVLAENVAVQMMLTSVFGDVTLVEDDGPELRFAAALAGDTDEALAA